MLSDPTRFSILRPRKPAGLRFELEACTSWERITPRTARCTALVWAHNGAHGEPPAYELLVESTEEDGITRARVLHGIDEDSAPCAVPDGMAARLEDWAIEPRWDERDSAAQRACAEWWASMAWMSMPVTPG